MSTGRRSPSSGTDDLRKDKSAQRTTRTALLKSKSPATSLPPPCYAGAHSNLPGISVSAHSWPLEKSSFDDPSM